MLLPLLDWAVDKALTHRRAASSSGPVTTSGGQPSGSRLRDFAACGFVQATGRTVASRYNGEALRPSARPSVVGSSRCTGSAPALAALAAAKPLYSSSVMSLLRRQGGTIGKAAGMISVSVGQHDGGWPQRGHATEPVEPPVDHNAVVLALDQKRAVPAMAPPSQFDFATSAEKLELDIREKHYGQGALAD